MRLTRHPCRVAHASESAFGQRGLTGRLKSKADQKQSEYTGGPVGANLFARRQHSQHRRRLTHRFAAFGSSYRMSVNPRKQVGSQAAALLILILSAPLNHAGRNSTLLCGANRQGCRFSRLRPWMAGGGGPTQQCRITGMPSTSEAPSGGARAFWLLLRCSKVTRCKSATNRCHYLINGYVHNIAILPLQTRQSSPPCLK